MTNDELEEMFAMPAVRHPTDGDGTVSFVDVTVRMRRSDLDRMAMIVSAEEADEFEYDWVDDMADMVLGNILTYYVESNVN